MNDIIKEKLNYESKLRDSEAQLKRLQNEQISKQEMMKKLEKEVSELRCSSSVKIDTEQAWTDIKNRSDLYDGVVKERNALKDQLCKMSGVDDVLRKLKKRADEADKMEEKVTKLERELQRFGYGPAGDEIPKRRVDSACKQCHKYANDLHRSETMLDAEIQKNVKTEAEANFLRTRVRTIDVMEAELILYKVKSLKIYFNFTISIFQQTKYEESSCKLMGLKEASALAEIGEKQVRDLKQQLTVAESQLKESERHAGELIASHDIFATLISI